MAVDMADLGIDLGKAWGLPRKTLIWPVRLLHFSVFYKEPLNPCPTSREIQTWRCNMIS